MEKPPVWHALHFIPEHSRSILDIGCNVGASLEYANKLGVRNLAGIDINPEAVKTAKERLAKLTAVNEIQLFHGSAHALPFKDQGFDVATFCEVLEHIPEELRANAIKEIHRVMMPDARLILTVPAKGLFSWLDPANFRLVFPGLFNFLSRWVGGRGREAGYENQNHGIVWHHHFTIAELKNILEPHFIIETIRWRGCLLTPICGWLVFPFYRRKLFEHPLLKIIQAAEKIDLGWQTGAFFAYNVLIVARRQ